MPLICCLACCHKDADLALKNAEWMRELDVGRGFEALLIINIEGAEKKLHEPILKALQATFSKVHFSTCTEDERLWPEEQRKWPWSENLTWTSAARYVRDNLRQPWLFLEADAVLLHESALNEINADYVTSGQPFLGQLVDTKDETGQQVPPHMSGVAVYPPDVTRYHDSALLGGGLAFDMVLKDMTTTAMKDSKLIHHCYHSPPFENLGHMRRIRKGAALFHQDKSGSLIDRLREARGLPLSIPSLPVKTISTGVSAPARPMITDIFIKSYPKDYPFLKYCLMSIERFACGFRQVVVVAPSVVEGKMERPIPLVVKQEPDREPGYLWQQVVKLHADRYTDADQILYIDSDTVFTKPVTPDTFMRNGKPIWMRTPWKDVSDSNAIEAWLPVMRNWFGCTPDFEYMRRMGQLVPVWLLKAMKDFTQFMHGKPMEQYVMEAGSFTEFNCMGLLAHAKYEDRFHWIDTSKEPAPELCVRQFYSHDGLDDETLRELDQILTLPLPQVSSTAAMDENGFGAVEERGWRKTDPENERRNSLRIEDAKPEQNPVSFAIATLAAEAQKSGLHKARMVAALVKAGLIEAKKKPAKRRMARA